jgi:hypothetical protein
MQRIANDAAKSKGAGRSGESDPQGSKPEGDADKGV